MELIIMVFGIFIFSLLFFGTIGIIDGKMNDVPSLEKKKQKVLKKQMQDRIAEKIASQPKAIDPNPEYIRKLEKELNIITLDDIPIERPQDIIKPSHSLDAQFPLPEKYKWLIAHDEDDIIYIGIAEASAYAAFVREFGENGGWNDNKYHRGIYTGFEFEEYEHKSLAEFIGEQDYNYGWSFKNDARDEQALQEGGQLLYDMLQEQLAVERAIADREKALRDFVQKVGQSN